MTVVLGIDSSSSSCSAAVWRDGAVLAQHARRMERGHAEALVPMIERVMAEGGLPYSALAAVAATAGPGAFTGLRIGLAAARGIALAAGKPAIGITAFAAVAAAIPAAARQQRPVAVAIDTKREDLYLQLFSPSLEPLDQALIVGVGGLAALLPPVPVFVAGDGLDLVRRALTARRRDVAFDGEPRVPLAADIAMLGAACLAAAATGAALPPAEPLYLRAPEATPLALQGKRP